MSSVGQEQHSQYLQVPIYACGWQCSVEVKPIAFMISPKSGAPSHNGSLCSLLQLPNRALKRTSVLQIPWSPWFHILLHLIAAQGLGSRVPLQSFMGYQRLLPLCTGVPQYLHFTNGERRYVNHHKPQISKWNGRTKVFMDVTERAISIGLRRCQFLSILW